MGGGVAMQRHLSTRLGIWHGQIFCSGTSEMWRLRREEAFSRKISFYVKRPLSAEKWGKARDDREEREGHCLIPVEKVQCLRKVAQSDEQGYSITSYVCHNGLKQIRQGFPFSQAQISGKFLV